MSYNDHFKCLYPPVKTLYPCGYLRGPTGPKGATGPTGPVGSTGATPTTSSMNAINTTGSPIDVTLSGTAIPLPQSQVLNNFTVDSESQSFTVLESGTYLVNYRILITESMLLSSRILMSGGTLEGSAFTPTTTTSVYSATTFATLAAGDVLQLQLYGLLATAVLQGGNSTSLTVIRLY